MYASFTGTCKDTYITQMQNVKRIPREKRNSERRKEEKKGEM